MYSAYAIQQWPQHSQNKLKASKNKETMTPLQHGNEHQAPGKFIAFISFIAQIPGIWLSSALGGSRIESSKAHNQWFAAHFVLVGACCSISVPTSSRVLVANRDRFGGGGPTESSVATESSTWVLLKWKFQIKVRNHHSCCFSSVQTVVVGFYVLSFHHRARSWHRSNLHRTLDTDWCYIC